ncbi:MAG: hypothetical protein K6E21_04700 [Bacilli bacterium]|nr:hypothetical protein [Bacilli bacterium]
MRRIELWHKYKVITFVNILLITLMFGFLIFLIICNVNDIDIEMTNDDYLVTTIIFGVLILICVAMFGITFKRCYYDEEYEQIVVVSYFNIKRRFVVDRRESIAIVYVSENKDKYHIALRHDGRFLLDIKMPKDSFNEDLKAMGVKAIVTINKKELKGKI